MPAGRLSRLLPALMLALSRMGGLVLTAAVLDLFVRTPGPMTVTTMMPGLVYASATVVKVCLVASLALAVAGLFRVATTTRVKASLLLTSATQPLGAAVATRI